MRETAGMDVPQRPQSYLQVLRKVTWQLQEMRQGAGEERYTNETAA